MELIWQQSTARFKFAVLAVVELAVVHGDLKQAVHGIVACNDTYLILSTLKIELRPFNHTVFEVID